MGLFLSIFLVFSGLHPDPGTKGNYDNQFILISSDLTTRQELFIRYNTDNEIVYKLVISKENCEKEVSGAARSNGTKNAAL